MHNVCSLGVIHFFKLTQNDNLTMGGRQRLYRRPDNFNGLLARKIIEGLGMEVATPDEAREILSLKGGDKVAF